MGLNDKFLVHWAIGESQNFAKAANRVGSWESLIKLLSKPTRTKERRAKFDKMSKDEQDRLKAIDGWISGAQCEGKWRNLRNVKPRDLLTIDIDYARPELLDEIEFGLTPISKWEFFTHSSRRHTIEAPRLRLFLPMSRDVSVDDFGALVRIFSFYLEGESPMKQVDKVSARGAQMMFLPTASADGDWFSYRNEGAILDPDVLFDWFEKNHGDWHDIAKLPLFDGEGEIRLHSAKAEDPTTKRGPVGNFCRAYDVEAAMKFIPEAYIPGDTHSGKPRYTYAGSTSSNGAVIEDGGLFIYSHHGHDPICEQLCNAFDMVRLHRFGELDKETDQKDTPVTKLPSYLAMVEFIADDPGYMKARAESNYDRTAMFEDVEEDDEEEPIYAPYQHAPDEAFAHLDEEDLALIGSGEGQPSISPLPAIPRPKRPKVQKDWFDRLEFDEKANIRNTLYNLVEILRNDDRTRGSISRNLLSENIVARFDITSKMPNVPQITVKDHVNGKPWTDLDDATLRAILEAPAGPGKSGYGLAVSERNLREAVILAAEANRFHPIKEYFEGLRWDGTPRLETVLVDYLGTPDTAYHRAVIRLALIAAVTRTYEPGHKFDNAIILEGKQGVRKSTFISVLARHIWFSELHGDMGNQRLMAEQLPGFLILELPELSGLRKTEVDDTKSFLARIKETVRLAYDRRPTTLQRQCIFIGSTNSVAYLKDTSGNRRMWPIRVLTDKIDTARLESEIDQIWAEAYHEYRQWRQRQPGGTLFLDLSKTAEIEEAILKQADAEAENTDNILAGQIEHWLATPVPLSTLTGKIEDKFDDEPMVLRTSICGAMIWQECLGGIGAPPHMHAQQIGRALELLHGWPSAGSRVYFGRYGRQRAYRDRNADPKQFLDGYRLVLDDLV